jgi:site-specific recombinase XerD
LDSILRREIWLLVQETREDLKYLFGKHVLPIVGNQPPRQVTFTSLQLLLNKLAADGYGETSVGRIRTYIKACFEYATDEDLVSKNPARKLEMPTIRKKVCERRARSKMLHLFLPWRSGIVTSMPPVIYLHVSTIDLVFFTLSLQ